MFLKNISEGTRIFIDANIFLYVALEQKHLKSCKDFLKRVRNGEMQDLSQ